MTVNPFLSTFVRRLVIGMAERQTHNRDPLRFADERTSPLSEPTRWLKNQVLAGAARIGFIPARTAAAFIDGGCLEVLLSEQERLNWLYGALADEPSRRLLIDILAYRVLTYRRVRLPTNNPEYWRAHEKLSGPILRKKKSRSAPGSVLKYLDRFDLHEIGFPIEFDVHPLNVLCTFLLQQYRYAGERAIEVEEGDVVLDGGGCWGDTALYFAHKAGPSGKVMCFEFLRDNLDILRANLDSNPGLSPRVSVIERALWNRSGEHLGMTSDGPGTRVDPVAATEAYVETVAIDDVVESAGLERVDFIKLDIEGAELDALKGAQRVLRKFRPKLAVALYHRNEDFAAIPTFLRDLELGYDFYLGHYTVHEEETILFAAPR